LALAVGGLVCHVCFTSSLMERLRVV
jgi:hypothetical protein